MPSFSARSLRRLGTCHPDLRRVLHELIRHHDFTVLCGWRGKEEQNWLYERGLSMLPWPRSKHNAFADIGGKRVPCSLAVDIAPYYTTPPHIRWERADDFVYLAGRLMGVADMLGVKVRNGNDWNRDNDLYNQTFFDRCHFELVEV